MHGLFLILTPFLCALIGWLTNRVAVKMLFHPRRPVRVLGLSIQGVFPKRKAALAENLSRVIDNELICGSDIGDMLRDPKLSAALHDGLDEYVDKLLSEGLPKAIPMAAMLLTPETKDKIKAVLLPELEAFLPEVLGKASSRVEEQLDVRGHVREKIESFSMDKLEEILMSIMRREFKFIELVGGVLGLLIGVFQAGLLALTN